MFRYCRPPSASTRASPKRAHSCRARCIATSSALAVKGSLLVLRAPGVPAPRLAVISFFAERPYESVPAWLSHASSHPQRTVPGVPLRVGKYAGGSCVLLYNTYYCIIRILHCLYYCLGRAPAAGLHAPARANSTSNSTYIHGARSYYYSSSKQPSKTKVRCS